MKWGCNVLAVGIKGDGDDGRSTDFHIKEEKMHLADKFDPNVK